MKISVIISTILIAQVSASFFDVLQGAVLSVQNSFGKLLGDVVTDVRDTVDCTLLALEHVLSLSDDASARYYEKCGNGTNKTDSKNKASQYGSPPKVEVSLKFSNNDQYLQKEIPAEIDARINETLKKSLSSYNPHEDLLSVENVLAKESKQLANISDLVKQEMEKLSIEINSDFKNMKQEVSVPSIDSILQEIKLLENKEQISKNTSEASEIHQVIDEVLDKLEVIEVTEATENDKLDEILKDLENNSNNSFIGLRQQFEEWKEKGSRHLDDIKNKVNEHEKIAKYPEHIYNIKSNLTRPVLLKTNVNDDIKEHLTKEQAALQKINNGSNEYPFREILNGVLNITPSPINIRSTNDKLAIIQPTLKTQKEPNEDLNTLGMEMAGSTISLSTIELTLNEAVIPGSLFSITQSSESNETIQPVDSKIDSENNESSTLTTNNPETITNMGNYSDPNNILSTSTAVITKRTIFTTTERTFISETISSVESTAASRNEKLLNLSSIQPITTSDTPQLISLNTPGKDYTVIISIPSTTYVNSHKYPSGGESSSPENKESSLLTTLQPIASLEVLNGTMLSSSVFAVTDSLYLENNVALINTSTTPTNRHNSTWVTKLNMTTPNILNDHGLTNIVAKRPLFTITESPIANKNIPLGEIHTTHVNKELLNTNQPKTTPNKFDQQNYNTSKAPANDLNDFRISHTAMDGKLATPPIIYNPPLYNSIQAQSNRPNVSKTYDLDYIRKRILETSTPFTIIKDTNNDISTTPANGPVIVTPQKKSRLNNNNAPLDYDSFFHIAKKNSEEHQRALKEARQLIEGSKRSDRIIDSILKNRNKNGTRSI